MYARDGGVGVVAHIVDGAYYLVELGGIVHIGGLQLGTVHHEGNERAALQALHHRPGIDRRGEYEVDIELRPPCADIGHRYVAGRRGTLQAFGLVAAVGGFGPHLEVGGTHPRLESELFVVVRARFGACAVLCVEGQGCRIRRKRATRVCTLFRVRCQRCSPSYSCRFSRALCGQIRRLSPEGRRA